jgi:large conductance mechanosensitive channel
MGMLKEFKDFALKGSVVDLAVAVVIGAAFGAIVSSMVDDVITPLLLTPALKAIHATNLSELTWGAVKYGTFISAVIKFIVIAFILFLVVKAINSMKKKEAAAPPPPTAEEIILLREIRDSLRK